VPKRAGRVAGGLDDMMISLYPRHVGPRHHATLGAARSWGLLNGIAIAGGIIAALGLPAMFRCTKPTMPHGRPGMTAVRWPRPGRPGVTAAPRSDRSAREPSSAECSRGARI
jgi:hypothetical protein